MDMNDKNDKNDKNEQILSDAPCKCLDCDWTGVRRDIAKETK